MVSLSPVRTAILVQGLPPIAVILRHANSKTTPCAIRKAAHVVILNAPSLHRHKSVARLGIRNAIRRSFVQAIRHRVQQM